MDKLINQFNRKNTYLIISGYPEKDGHGNHYGMSWYTKETIGPIAKTKNAKFVVLAESNGNNESRVYKDGRILVLRIFDQRHLSLYPYILTWLSKFNRIKKVYVHSEFGANGGIKNFIFLIPFLILIKATGRKITFFAHNFVTSFDVVAIHLNLLKFPLLLTVLNMAVKIYNFALGIIVDKIVVMDEMLAKRAEKYIVKDKIISVPMLVRKPSSHNSPIKARETLGINNDEFVLLYFGFMTHYKGIDWIIDQVKNLNEKINDKKVRLIIAGGKAYSLKDKKYYQQFFNIQQEKINASQNILQTGFIREKEIGKYFSASDLVVFPYRGLIGSSGALSYAISYKKPFIVSSNMSEVLDSTDMRECLKKTGLQKTQLVFDLNEESFKQKLVQVMSPKVMKKLARFSLKLRQVRDYSRNMENYYKTIFTAVDRGFIYTLISAYEAIFSKFAIS